MGEPRAITYKEVRKAAESDLAAKETWRKIGEISGAGHVPPNEEAAIALTEVSPSKIERIEKLLNPVDDVVIDEGKKRGNK